MDYSNKKTLKDVNLKNKKVIVRVDFNVPIKDGKITDNNRIKAAIPTIKYLIENDAKIILLSHLSRIKSEEDKKIKSLKVVSDELSNILNMKVNFIDSTRGSKVEDAVSNLKSKEIILLENTRFEDFQNNELVKYESKNNEKLGKYWASLADVFVNDAFGTAHRAHASNVGISNNIKESCIGLLIEKELNMLGNGINNPKKPFIAILGGAKVSDKIGVIENLLNKVDYILIGGGMTYTFYKALGHSIGKSLIEEDKISLANELLNKANGKIILPIDNACANEFKDQTPIYTDKNIGSDLMGLDIGNKTIDLYKKYLSTANTIVWNGPMGVTEFDNFSNGTNEICKEIANRTNDGSFTLIGGGDSAAAAIKLGYKDDFSWISTGGGASLEFMEGKELPGIKAISNK